VTVHEFSLEGGEEALGDGVVQHWRGRLSDWTTQWLARRVRKTEECTGYRVGVEDESRCRVPREERHAEGVADEARTHVLGNGEPTTRRLARSITVAR